MRKMQLTSVLAASLLVFSPAVPVFDLDSAGIAHAKGNGNGNGNGNGGKPESGKSGSQKSDMAKGKSETAGTSTVKKKPKVAAESAAKVAKGKPAKEGELAPNELGKMNGAMNANINAVLAHIRNGQTTKGPVGLLAGLAVADSADAAADAKVAELEQLAADFDALEAKVQEAGFETVEDYLQARQDGTLTEEQLALSGEVDGMIEAVGGTDATGLALAQEEPLPEDIEAAKAAAEESGQAVADAEQAILDAWNKDGDADALLTGLRAKLAPHQAEIDATISAKGMEDETAALPPEEEAAIVVK